MLNFKQLYYFLSVAKAGSITRAAEQLHLTPQTLSGQISKLEEAVGTDLFKRVGRRLELIAAGKAAVSHADEIFQMGKELEATLRGRTTGKELPFRVGVADAVPKSVAYRLLAPALLLDEPVRLVCHEDKMEPLFAELAVHQLDLVIADRPLPAGLHVRGYNHALGRSGVVLLAAPALAERYRERYPHSLERAPLLLPSLGTAVRAASERWLRERELEPHVIAEFDDTALMKAFGQAGAGLFPAPAVVADEVCSQYRVEVVGHLQRVSVSYYAISLQRRLSHPAVIAVTTAARTGLFRDDAASGSVSQ